MKISLPNIPHDNYAQLATAALSTESPSERQVAKLARYLSKHSELITQKASGVEITIPQSIMDRVLGRAVDHQFLRTLESLTTPQPQPRARPGLPMQLPEAPASLIPIFDITGQYQPLPTTDVAPSVDLGSKEVQTQLRSMVQWQSRCGMFSSGLGLKITAAREMFMNAVGEMATNPVGLEILTALVESGQQIDVVLVPGGEGEFLMPHDPTSQNVAALDRPTIVWDPTRNFRFYANVVDHGDRITGELHQYPSWMVLLHEMGHCKQFMEDNVSGARYEATLRDGLFDDAQPGVARIEADNLARHEALAARAEGWATRSHYQHFPNSPVVNAWTTQGKNLEITDRT